VKPLLVVTLVALGIASALAETREWQSPDHFYAISVPPDWEQTEIKVKSHTSYTFRSPDGQASIAISATYDLSLPEILPDDVLEAAFPKERRVTDIKRIRGAGWDGLQCEYADESDTKRWSAITARNGSTVVLLTMTSPTNTFDQFRDTFEKVGNSLKLGQ
jgi:hypothetical protein